MPHSTAVRDRKCRAPPPPNASPPDASTHCPSAPNASTPPPHALPFLSSPAQMLKAFSPAYMVIFLYCLGVEYPSRSVIGCVLGCAPRD